MDGETRVEANGAAVIRPTPVTGGAGNNELTDSGLDWYDRFLTQTFPASDALPLW